MVDMAMKGYMKAATRFATIREIIVTMEPPKQMQLVGTEGLEKKDQLKGLLAYSQRVEPGFRAKVKGFTVEFNGASASMDVMFETFGFDEATVCAETGLSRETFGKLRKLELRHPSLEVEPGKPEVLALVRFGPPKSFERAIDKDLDWLMDLNRVTIQFQNTAALALYYFALRKRFKVVGIKNLHDPEQNEGYSKPPCIHLWLDWEDSGFIVEVMLILTAFLEIKKAQHYAYEMTRAKSPFDLLTSWRMMEGDIEPGDLDFAKPKVVKDWRALEAEVAAKDAENAAQAAEITAKDAEIAQLKAALQGKGLALPPPPGSS